MLAFFVISFIVGPPVKVTEAVKQHPPTLFGKSVRALNERRTKSRDPALSRIAVNG